MTLRRADNRIPSPESYSSVADRFPARSSHQAKAQRSLRTGAGGVGGLVAVSVDGDFYFPGYDNNGNVIGYWNEDGEIVAEYAYDAFGNTIYEDGDLADFFPHRFSTKYYDAETDLYYYGYRYYSPSLGRWISRDPIGEEGGWNLYCFVGNMPNSVIDVLGENRFLTGALVPQEYTEDGFPLVVRRGGEHDALRVIALIAALNRKYIGGKKCYNAEIRDFPTSSDKDVKDAIATDPDGTYIIAHGGLEVNGTTYPYYRYDWRKRDSVVEGLSRYANSPLIPLSDFGPSRVELNFFGCYISDEVRKKHYEGNRVGVISSWRDDYNLIYKRLYKRLERHLFVTDCRCQRNIIVFEGEQGAQYGGMTSSTALRRHGLPPQGPDGEF